VRNTTKYIIINVVHRLENTEPEPTEPRLKNHLAWSLSLRLENVVELSLEPRLSLSLWTTLIIINRFYS
jgi:hypothetical protein